MLKLVRKIVRNGRVAEPAPSKPVSSPAHERIARLGASLQLREVDCGSCNACEVEFAAAFGPVYDAERYGIRVVASPRHADGLVVTGPVTHNMAVPLEKTYEATPAPKVVIALGDCAIDCGVFKGGHGVRGAVADLVPVDIEIPGCPPEPDVIIAALRSLIDR